MNKLKAKVVYRCERCGGTSVQGTAWLYLNGERLANSDPPTDQIWCPDCNAEVDVTDRVEDVVTPPNRVFVVTYGGAIQSAWSTRAGAERSCFKFVAAIYTNGGYEEEDVPPPTDYAAVLKWNDFWDSEPDMHALVHEVVLNPEES